MIDQKLYQYALASKRAIDGEEILHSGWFLSPEAAVEKRVTSYPSTDKIYIVRRPFGAWEHYEFGDQLIAFAYNMKNDSELTHE